MTLDSRAGNSVDFERMQPFNEAAAAGPELFGVLRDRREVHAVTLSNAHGLRARVITYGAIIVSLEAPDARGVFDDVVLGHDDLKSYELHSPYFGAVAGRYANRIANGRFELDNVPYELSRNEEKASLHGGVTGFDKAVWKIENASRNSVMLKHVSSDGDQGFPGELTATVAYTLADSGALVIGYAATTSAPTVVNLTQHTYWNLGRAGADILAHELEIDADHFTPVDEYLIPTGEIRAVEGTPFDFRAARTVGAAIDQRDEQLRIGSGYDHNFVLTRQPDGRSRRARMRDPRSGRTLSVETTEPGIQLYTGNLLDGTIVGKNGIAYNRHAGLCLETQHFPDSPNQPAFPNTILRPGEVYASESRFRFSVDPSVEA
jgi:aldose 1-epimerase